MTKSKSKTTSSSNSSASFRPQIPGYMQGPQQDLFGQLSGMTNQTAPGATPTQIKAFQEALNLGTSPGYGQAQDATRWLMNNFQTPSVQAGQLANTSLDPYLENQQGLIDATMADWQQANDLGLNSLRSYATGFGGMGGNRLGVAMGQYLGDQGRSLASTLANIRSGNYQRAIDSARYDIGNRLGADQFNAGNVLAGAGLRLGAANQLGSLAGAEGDAQRANILTQAGIGETERQLDPTLARLDYLSRLWEMINPGAWDSLYGYDATEQGTQTSKTTGSPSLLDSLGRIVAIARGVSGKGG